MLACNLSTLEGMAGGLGVQGHHLLPPSEPEGFLHYVRSCLSMQTQNPQMNHLWPFQLMVPGLEADLRGTLCVPEVPAYSSETLHLAFQAEDFESELFRIFSNHL